MKSILLYCCSFCLLWCLSACDNSMTADLTPTNNQARLVGSMRSTPKESFKVKAKFIDFEMGDVAHYLFEDEQGEIWDFTNCADKDYVFRDQLSNEQSNDFNRGWRGNKMLQGRWFLLECGVKKQASPTDGSEEIAQVIQEATLLY